MRNWFMRSSTCDGTADEQGRVTDDSVALYRDLAPGEVGRSPRAVAPANKAGDAVKPYSQERAAAVKKNVSVLLMGVGGIRTVAMG